MNQYQFIQARLVKLSTPELHAIMVARQTVFIGEQKICYPDADEYDFHSWHLRALHDGQIAGYLRMVDPGIKYDEPSIGRVLTAASYRKTGLGKFIMQIAINDTAHRYPGLPIRISAQTSVQPFYQKLGFIPVGEIYQEAGIPHIEMLRPSTV